MDFIIGNNRHQGMLLPDCIEDYVDENNPVRVIDAYVDAQLSAFDISKDLSLNVKPTVIQVHSTKSSTAVGIGCGLNF